MVDSDNDSAGGQRNSSGSNNNAGGAYSELWQKEQDRFLPIANVSRIMKKALPANAKISKDAKETVQECVSEFISFITGEASDKCQREKRKTINGDDLLWAMTTLGFEDYVDPLKVYLQTFRAMEGEKNALAGRQSVDKEASSGSVGAGAGVGVELGSGGSGFSEGEIYGMTPSIMMMGHQNQLGHVYGPAAYNPMGGPVSGKVNPVYLTGSGSSGGRVAR